MDPFIFVWATDELPPKPPAPKPDPEKRLSLIRAWLAHLRRKGK